jgi:hypothetical protein
VGANDDEGGVGTPVEFGESGVIVPDFFHVVSEQYLSCAQDGGHAAMAIEGAAVVEGVADVQKPSVASINGYGCVPAGVTWK